MATLVITLHLVVAIFLILVVLVQGGNQGGVGAAFGGGNSQGVFGATGATSLLGKLTYAAATIFMCTTISLTFIMGSGGKIDLGEKLEQASAADPEKASAQETEKEANSKSETAAAEAAQSDDSEKPEETPAKSEEKPSEPAAKEAAQ